MAINPAAYSFALPGLVSVIVWWWWLRHNTISFWRHKNTDAQFESAIIPGPNYLIALMVATLFGSFITLVVPHKDLVSRDPYEDEWVLPHHLHSAMYFGMAVTVYNAWSSEKSLGADRARTFVLFAFALYNVLFVQMLMAPQHIPSSVNDNKGWDHESWLQDIALSKFVMLRYVLAIIFVIEGLMMAAPAWELAFFRCAFALADAVYWFTLAGLFGGGWCDNYDGLNYDRCDEDIMGVNAYSLDIILPAIILFAVSFTHLYFFQKLPSWVYRVTIFAIPPPRRGSSTVGAVAMRTTPGRSRNGPRTSGVPGVDTAHTDTHTLADDDADDEIDLH